MWVETTPLFAIFMIKNSLSWRSSSPSRLVFVCGSHIWIHQFLSGSRNKTGKLNEAINSFKVSEKVLSAKSRHDSAVSNFMLPRIHRNHFWDYLFDHTAQFEERSEYFLPSCSVCRSRTRIGVLCSSGRRCFAQTISWWEIPSRRFHHCALNSQIKQFVRFCKDLFIVIHLYFLLVMTILKFLYWNLQKSLLFEEMQQNYQQRNLIKLIIFLSIWSSVAELLTQFKRLYSFKTLADVVNYFLFKNSSIVLLFRKIFLSIGLTLSIFMAYT